MANRYPYSQRSKDAPMDFQWTNRSPVKPVWAAEKEDPSTPKKRNHDDLNPPATPVLGTPQRPIFGTNQNVPFLFQPMPVPQTPTSEPWAPPPNFSPTKAFPHPNEVPEIDMAEVTPSKAEERMDTQEQESERPVAAGALRRVYKKRLKQSERLVGGRKRSQGEDDISKSDSDSDDEGQITPLTQNTSNHYTLNMPGPSPPQSDTPYVLLGYLQFFFNLTLILIFLYLVVQFILTVQRDVEHRISEYSQDIIQEIGMCRAQHINNMCAENRIPAMAQQCANWETCMNRDPALVGRARVGAELIAEVVNGFVEPISWKTLIFTLTSLAFLTVFINALLTLYRSKHQPNNHSATHPTPAFPIPPSTPYDSNPYGGYLSPAPPPWGRYRSEEELESPTRRRRLIGGGAAKIK